MPTRTHSMNGIFRFPQRKFSRTTPANDKDNYTDDALGCYLRNIGTIPQLTPAEEMELARQMRKGDARARELMIISNLRLVVTIAKEYADRGMDFSDLINEGNKGLIKGVDRFNPNKGAKISTYASWWIRQAITHALYHQVRTIRLPPRFQDKLSLIHKTAAKLEVALHREPSDEEVAAELGMKPSKVRKYRNSRGTVSLDTTIYIGFESVVIEDVIPDEKCELPSDFLARTDSYEMLTVLLKQLSPREQMIVRLRFGFGDGIRLTLEEVGKRFRLNRERIRQIQKEALAKLRRFHGYYERHGHCSWNAQGQA